MAMMWKRAGLAMGAALALAACEAPPAPDGGATEETAEQIQGTPPPTLGPEDAYRQMVTGRWSERPACAGMTWNFQPDSFTTPGEVHCAAVAVSGGADDTVRVAGSGCRGEGAPQPDVTLDVTVTRPADGSDRIEVTGVGNGVSTLGWTRCE